MFRTVCFALVLLSLACAKKESSSLLKEGWTTELVTQEESLCVDDFRPTFEQRNIGESRLKELCGCYLKTSSEKLSYQEFSKPSDAQFELQKKDINQCLSRLDINDFRLLANVSGRSPSEDKDRRTRLQNRLNEINKEKEVPKAPAPASPAPKVEPPPAPPKVTAGPVALPIDPETARDLSDKEVLRYRVSAELNSVVQKSLNSCPTRAVLRQWQQLLEVERTMILAMGGKDVLAAHKEIQDELDRVKGFISNRNHVIECSEEYAANDAKIYRKIKELFPKAFKLNLIDLETGKAAEMTDRTWNEMIAIFFKKAIQGIDDYEKNRSGGYLTDLSGYLANGKVKEGATWHELNPNFAEIRKEKVHPIVALLTKEERVERDGLHWKDQYFSFTLNEVSPSGLNELAQAVWKLYADTEIKDNVTARDYVETMQEVEGWRKHVKELEIKRGKLEENPIFVIDEAIARVHRCAGHISIGEKQILTTPHGASEEEDTKTLNDVHDRLKAGERDAAEVRKVLQWRRVVK